ncbi:RNA-directed DNA polymerase, eukaryota, reverse transcriptase zinc-binding domain protein [Tanacetum coccineum]|uniref:RNA-directed DNA polymerase, eukaryota, reverse transcriptase zinc-binding domain protein n=1 Tax=Tanacetum coccineum TaxID=301880 RepID=A0ABQ4YMI3_9ASTR
MCSYWENVLAASNCCQLVRCKAIMDGIDALPQILPCVLSVNVNRRKANATEISSWSSMVNASLTSCRLLLCIWLSVPVAKGFQVGKQFNYQPKAPKTNSDGGSTREATSSKVGSSSYSNEGASHKVTSIDKHNDKDVVDTGAMKISNISSPNPFTVLGEVEDEDEDIENVYDESENLNLNHNPGASTPAQTVPDVYVCAILESHVDVAVVYDTCKKVCSRWKWTSNGSLCDKGSRIILGWNDDLVDVMIMAQTNQVMHVQVNTRIDNKTLFCSFIYADNYYIDRRALWNNLVGHAGLMRNRPWVLLGDFNAALNIEDHSSGGYEPNVAMRDFKECVQAMEVADVNSTGLHFTWNQKPKGSNGILKKIDRIMGLHVDPAKIEAVKNWTSPTTPTEVRNS